MFLKAVKSVKNVFACANLSLQNYVFHIIITTLFLKSKAFKECFLPCNVSNAVNVLLLFCHMFIPDKDVTKHTRLGVDKCKLKLKPLKPPI